MVDSIEAGGKVAEMWERLATQLSDGIPDLVINDHPLEAIRWATYAEACFWKATGEADTHDVKDVFKEAASRAALTSEQDK